MTWWGAVMISIVALAIPGTLWLKREGEREWKRHQAQMRREALARALDDVVQMVVKLGEAFSEVSAKFARFGIAMSEQISRAYGVDVVRGDGKSLTVPPHLEGNRIAGAWKDEHLRVDPQPDENGLCPACGSSTYVAKRWGEWACSDSDCVNAHGAGPGGGHRLLGGGVKP